MRLAWIVSTKGAYTQRQYMERSSIINSKDLVKFTA
jgi:hypothetical protein